MTELVDDTFAQYVADHLLTNEQSILSLVQEDRSIGQRIKGWLDKLLAKLGNGDAQERVFLRNARDLYARALEQTQQKPTQASPGTEDSRRLEGKPPYRGTEQEDGGAEKTGDTEQDTQDSDNWKDYREYLNGELAAGRITEEHFDEQMEFIRQQEELEMYGTPVEYSFAGVGAKNADLQALDTAEEMERRGVSAETIRQQTDWFRGKDGKWRFEVDDSTSRVSDEITNYMKLKDLLEDAKILEEYPDLAEMDVVFQNLEPGVNASYDPQFDAINVRYDLKEDPEAIRGAVLHEIQHAIQRREGFSKGTTVRAWERKLNAGFDSRKAEDIRNARETERQIAQIRETEPEFYRDMMELDAMTPTVERGKVDWDTLEKIEEDPPEWQAYDARREELEAKYGDIKVWDFNHLLYEQERNAKNRGRTALELYYETAGEIEARNVAGRRNLTEEERKKTPPVLGGEDTVLAEGNGVSAEYVGKTADGIEVYETSDAVKKMPWKDRKKLFLSIMENQYRGRTAKFVRNGHSYYAKFDIRDVNKNIYGDKDSDDKGRDAKVNAGADGNIFELVENSKYIGSLPETGKPGKIHKGVKYWDYFVKTVQIDGTVFDLTANVRKKPDGQFVYVIEMHENKEIEASSPEGSQISGLNGVPNTSMNSISDASDEVKQQFSISPVTEGEEAQKGEDATPQSASQTAPLTQGSLEDPDPMQAEVRTSLPAKARGILEKAERKLENDLGDKLYVPRIIRRSFLRPIVQELSNAYLKDGTVNQEKVDFLFDKAFTEGIIADAEFYDQYKDVKQKLRTTAVTLGEGNRADIADYQDFKKRSRYVLRVTDSGGLPVDVAYMELREMAPELFPESITHPADQLQHMYEVSNSIKVSEYNLQQYFGDNAAEFRTWAKDQFQGTVQNMAGELRKVKRYGDEAAAKEAARAEIPSTVEEVNAAYAKLKDARKAYERVQAKALLTDEDNMAVGRLLRGEILPEHLDAELNTEDILRVYEAKKEYEAQAKVIAKYKQHLKDTLRQKADTYLETALQWKDKAAGILYSRETMRRNIQDIVKDKDLAKRINDEYFEPVHTAEAAATRFKNEFRDKVRAMGISTKLRRGDLVSEAHAVQLYGEAMDNIEMIRKSKGRMKTRDGKTEAEWQAVIEDMFRQSPSLDRGKIERSVEQFRKIYDDLYTRMNEVRVRNGYEPVNYRHGYFPHFQPGDGDGMLLQFGKALGIDTQTAALPTTINGLTHTFRPGIQWFGHAQERLGFNTAYDAVEGFDKYIEGVANVIYQTENIQKLRALESQIRYRTSPEGIQKQVDAVNADSRLTEDEKRMKIDAIYKNGKFALSNFVNELSEYTNLLAGKKSRLDRGMEAAIGRRMYTIMKNFESRVGANMVAGNLGSALTNFIPLTQAAAQLDRNMILHGMWNTLKNYKENDGFGSASDFLTNRQGSDVLVKKWTEKVSAVLGTPMEYIDGFVSESIVRAAYEQNVRNGMSEAEAMYEADIFASGVMADRSKGAMPTLFESKNPLVKAFTQFQLEVNNQFSEVFKDVPRRNREKGLAVLAGVLFKYFLGAFLYNEVYEFFLGRRPAMDPIGILNDTVGDWTGYELPNLVEAGINTLKGEETSLETEQVGAGEAIKNLGSQVLGELPFSSGLTLLGVETDGGRIPASSAIPDLTALWDAATTEGWSSEKRWYEAQQELSKLAYVLPPFGGGQASKMWKGIEAFLEGGSYSVDSEGNDILQYPVFREEDGFGTFVRSALFGKSSLPEAQDWVESGFDSLSARQTAVYQDMVAAGAGEREAYELLRKLEGVEKTETQSVAEQQREILMGSGLSDDAQAIVYYGMMANETNRELMDTLTDQGADSGEVANVLMKIRNAAALTGAEASCAKRDVIADSTLTDEEKHAIYREKISDAKEEEISQLRAAGLSFNDFLEIQNRYTQIGEEYSKATDKATAFSHWVNQQGYTERQITAIKDSFTYYSMVPATADRYENLVSSGLGEEASYGLATELSELEPAEGKTSVDDLQKYRAIIDYGLSEKEQLKALEATIGSGLFERVSAVNSVGVTPEQYLKFREILPNFDTNGSGSFSQDEVKAALDSMGESGYDNSLLLLMGIVSPGEGLTNSQKAAIWQSYNKTWKPKSNPYDKDVGQRVYHLMNEEETEQETSTSTTDFGDEMMRQIIEKMLTDLQ